MQIAIEALFINHSKGFLKMLVQPTRLKQNGFAFWVLSLLFVILPAKPILWAQSGAGYGNQVRTEIPYRNGTVVLISDFQERTNRTSYRAWGNVLITFNDFVMTSEEVVYDEATREGYAKGQTRFSQKQQWLVCSRAEFNLRTETGVFYDASGYTDQEFLVSGKTIFKTGPDTYRVEDGMITSCQENRPKWSFAASKTNLRVDGTARLHNLKFKIKGIPVFYMPYLIVPMEKKERSSGFLPFHLGSSTSKGRSFSQGYFQTLGRSADVTIYGDYFSLRGLAVGSIFRARPNPTTHFNLEAYGIKDKLQQSGILLSVDGETRLGNDWRAVAQVNITSNFNFRQAFSDSFRSATISHEKAIAFLTRNHGSISTNISYHREEVLFPIQSLVIRKIPSIELNSLGTPLGRTPFTFSLQTSLDGLSRRDLLMETERLIQRLDLYPRVAVRLPPFMGFSLIPSAGVRETYYGARMSEDSPSGVSNDGLHRHYADLNIELRTPTLERNFSSSWIGEFQHVVEPSVTYRWIHGITNLQDTIRFDDQDALADTNEVQYGITNRFFRERNTGAGIKGKYEFMSIALIQKYYFDPTFGGAFQPGQLNSFYPLDTATGFYRTGIQQNLSPLSAVLQLSPGRGIHHDLRADYDIKLDRWRNASLSTLWQQGNFYLAGTYFLIKALEPGLLSSDHLQGQIGYGSFQRGLSASMTLSYNLQTARLLNSQTRVNYIWNCCGVAVEFTQYDLGLRRESRFTFSFSLKGIGSFGNLKRPENLF